MLRSWGALCACMVMSLSSMSACLIDKDDRCGPNMELREGLCMCVAGATISSNQCVFVDAGAPPPASGPGAICNATTPCAGTEAPYCHMSGAGDGYCTTSGCTDPSQCSGDFVCVTTAAPTYCRRPYTGQGMACASAADCAQYDANFCSTLTKLCLVRDCTPGSCDRGFECIDAAKQYGIPGAPLVCLPEGAGQ